MSKIREALVEDMFQIYQVSAQLEYSLTSSEEAKHRLIEIFESNSDYLWVYEDNKNIKGWLHLFIALRLASPKFAEIGGLVVDETNRRSGIATKLVEHAKQWSKNNNFSLIVRCNSKREAANKFYQGVSLKLIKNQRVYLIC